MTKPDYRKYGSDIAVEIIKQLITLSSAFVVVTGTVINVFHDKTTNSGIEYFWLAIASWFLAIVSISSGILALGGIATSAHDKQEFNVDAPYTRMGMRSQQVCFILMFVTFAFFAASNAYD